MYPKTKSEAQIPCYEYPDEESRVMGYISLDDDYKVLSNGTEFLEIQTDRFRAYVSKAALKQAQEVPKTLPKKLPKTEQEFRSQVMQQDSGTATVNKDYFRQIANIKTSKLIVAGIVTGFNLLSIHTDIDSEALVVTNIAGGIAFLALEVAEISAFKQLSE